MIVMGKKDCPFCVRAVALLDSNNFEYTYIDVEHNDESTERLKGLGIKTVPAIFLEDVFMGGYTELRGYIRAMTNEIK